MTAVGLAGTVAASAVSAGLALVSATVLGVRMIQPPGTVSPAPGFPFYLLVFGTIGGVVLAGIVAWMLLAPIDTYRRGGLALVCAFATVMLMLVCMPVDQSFGRQGLVGLLVVSALAALLFARRARRAARADAEHGTPL